MPRQLAQLSKDLGFVLVYISTGSDTFAIHILANSPHYYLDYVFDGTSPPYHPSSETNPLQLYGRTKRGGEVAVLTEVGAKVVVLRVPVLSVCL